MVEPMGNRVEASRRGRGARGLAETGTRLFVGLGLYRCQRAIKPSNCEGVKLCSISFPANHSDSTPSLDILLYSHLVVPEGEIVLRQLTIESNDEVATASNVNLKRGPQAYCANSLANTCLRVRGRRWYGFTSAVDTFRVRCFLPRIVTCTRRPVRNTSVTLHGLRSGRAEASSLCCRDVCCSLIRAPTRETTSLDRDSG